jgi:hypothetical protein
MPAVPTAVERGLLDTSIFIAQESGRALGTLPTAAAISVVTVAELHLGVLMADRAAVRARRSRTLTSVQSIFEPLPIDSEVARIRGDSRGSTPPWQAAENHGHWDSRDSGDAWPSRIQTGR